MDEGTVAWRALLDEATKRLAAAGFPNADHDARLLVTEASGAASGEFAMVLDHPATRRGIAHFDAMLERRLTGEPLQYVLGAWGFRRLDLAIDGRVLIPRPETEIVVDHVLAELHRQELGGGLLHVVDLGTGSGAIALAVAFEHPRVEVWATDISAEALEVARANLAGLGRAGTRVRLAEGSWFDALPRELRGQIDVVVSNPPYIRDDEVLSPEVEAWEPRVALRAGPRGVEAYEAIFDTAPAWLSDRGGVVVEIASDQADHVAALARANGFEEIDVHRDLAARPRVVVARLTGAST